jgi:hypothetical protein
MIAHVGSLAERFIEGGGSFEHPSGFRVPTSSPVSFGTNDAWQVTHDPERVSSVAPRPVPIDGPLPTPRKRIEPPSTPPFGRPIRRRG